MRCVRGTIAVALALVAAPLAGCTRAPELTPAAPAPIVGAWRSSVQFKSGAFAAIKDLQFLYVFNAGGTMTESSNYDEVPPVAPAYGEWRETAPHEVEAKYTFFTMNPPKDTAALTTGGGWPPAGSGVLTERIRIADDGTSFDSTIALALFDVDGKPAPGGAEATAHGVRAGFDAAPQATH